MASDLARAELVLIKLVQHKHFEFDIQQLNSGRAPQGGGRLGYAQLKFEQQHPLLLPSKDPLVNRLIDFCHQKNLHTGPHLLEALIRQKYWILSGRNLIRNRVHSCNHCFRFRPTAKIPLMADLPAYRLLERMVQDFWARWHLEYLHTLQTRSKWNKESANIKVGMVVVVKTDNAPPLHWPLAIVTEVFPGQDGIVRVVRTYRGFLV
ncbi:hypothetical protein NQ317_019893 [Molorchus minor]|uniref:DUF5641 domain-containing protein n=1 Tax=Molorchus minor TaxID=1323400 RepID=A0ABQ9IV11_9CUCU|nr:hypothetical protein NQ317_019893 [Molorchus minor]